MHDYNLFRVQLNHTPEYSRPEIKMDLTSLVPKRTSISSDTSSAPFTCHRLFILSPMVTEYLLHGRPSANLWTKEEEMEQSHSIVSLL